MPLSDHLRKIIPGAICAAIGGIMLLFGGLFYFVEYMTYQQMAQYCDMYAEYGVEYMYDFCTQNSGAMSSAIGVIVFGCIFLVIGIGYLAKGVSIYRNPSMRFRRQKVLDKRVEAEEEEDEEEELPESRPTVRAQAASQCPLCGEILLDTMATCPSCHRPVGTRLAMPVTSPPAEDKAVQYKNYCMYCGNGLPDTPDLAFCPICGKKIG